MRARSPGPTYFPSAGNECMVLAFSAGGAALMNTWLAMAHASMAGHLVTTIPWLSLALLSLMRIRRTRPDDKRDSGVSGMGGTIVLLIAGGAVGLLVLAGSAVVLGVCAIGCSFAPWHRIRFCRRHPVSASLLPCGGGALVLAIHRHDVEFMFLPIAAWILGMTGLIALLGTTRKTLPAKQAEKTAAAPVQP